MNFFLLFPEHFFLKMVGKDFPYGSMEFINQTLLRNSKISIVKEKPEKVLTSPAFLSRVQRITHRTKHCPDASWQFLPSSSLLPHFPVP